MRVCVAVVALLLAHSSSALISVRGRAGARAAVRHSGAPVRSGGKLEKEELQQPGALAATASLDHRLAEAGMAADAHAVASAEVSEPITLAIFLVLKLVTAVSAGFTQMHQQKSKFLQDAASEELAELKREAGKEAAALTQLFDEAVGDINTRFRDTISDLVKKQQPVEPHTWQTIDLVYDDAFLTDTNSAYLLRTISAGLQSLQARGGAGGGVHTVEELSLLGAAAELDRAAPGAPAAGSQRAVFQALLAAALRREFDAVFGWTARPDETLLLKAVSTGFGELAGRLPPSDPAAAAQLLASRARLDQSLDANNGTLQRLTMLKDAYSRALEDVYEVVGDRAAQTAEGGGGGGGSGSLVTAAAGVKAVKTKAQMNVLERKISGTPSKLVEGTATAASALELVVAAASALQGVAEATAASNKADVVSFTTKRDVAVLRERVAVDKRLGLVNLCDMMSALQEVLASFLASTDDMVAAQADDIAAAVLGAAAAQLQFADAAAFKARLARTFFARLCALLVPAHNRLAALFRGAGQCRSGAIEPLLTPATSAARYADARRRPAATLAGSGDDDIYDVQLVEGAGQLAQWVAAGYEQVGGGAAGGGTELNGDLCEPCSQAELAASDEMYRSVCGKCLPGTPAPGAASRRLFILRRKGMTGRSALYRAWVQLSAGQIPEEVQPVVDALGLDARALLARTQAQMKGLGLGASYTDYLAGLAEPVSDFTLARLARQSDGALDTRELKKRLGEGWVPLRLVKGGPGLLQSNNLPRLSVTGDALQAAAAAAAAADLNAGYPAADEKPPVIVPLVRRGGRTALVDIASLPFHRMLDGGGKDIELLASDFAFAERAPFPWRCANIITPDAACTVTDAAVYKSTFPGVEGAVAGLVDVFTRSSEAKLRYFSHRMVTQCPAATADGWPAAWERIALSPKDGAPLAGTQKWYTASQYRAELARPYVWVRRRFALPASDRAGDIRDLPACPEPCAGGLIKSARVRGAASAADRAGIGAAYERLQRAYVPPPPPAPERARSVSNASRTLARSSGSSKYGWATIILSGMRPVDFTAEPGLTLRCAAALPHPPAGAPLGAVVLTKRAAGSSADLFLPAPGFTTFALYNSSGTTQPGTCYGASGKCPSSASSTYIPEVCLCIPVTVLGGEENLVETPLFLVEQALSRSLSSYGSGSRATYAPLLKAFMTQYEAFLSESNGCLPIYM